MLDALLSKNFALGFCAAALVLAADHFLMGGIAACN